MLTIDGFLNVKAIILASTKHCGTIGYANRKTISTSNDCESSAAIQVRSVAKWYKLTIITVSISSVCFFLRSKTLW